jgi:hypothetical protein
MIYPALTILLVMIVVSWLAGKAYGGAAFLVLWTTLFLILGH